MAGFQVMGERGHPDIGMRCQALVQRIEEIVAILGEVLPGILTIEDDRYHGIRF